MEWPVLTNKQALSMLAKIVPNPGFGDMCLHHPNFKKAVDMLPDTSGFRACNIMIQEVMQDVIKKHAN